MAFVRRSRSPELPVILLEDAGALLGLVFALLGVGLTVLTGNGVFDGIATGCIGVLLVSIAIILATEIKSLLIGESALPEEVTAVHTVLLSTRAWTGSSTCARCTSAPRNSWSPRRSPYPRATTAPASPRPSTTPRRACVRRCRPRRLSTSNPTSTGSRHRAYPLDRSRGPMVGLDFGVTDDHSWSQQTSNRLRSQLVRSVKLPLYLGQRVRRRPRSVV
ncbi:hypothetical protein NKG94_51240 [Micromonospora sp. M12]